MAWIRIAILALIWGSSFILIKRGLFSADGQVLFSGYEVAAIRIASAFLVLLPIILRHVRSLSRRELKIILLSGFIGNGLPALLFSIAQTHISSSTSGVLNALTPIFAALVGVWFFKNAFNRKVLLGLILGLSGSITLIVSAKGFSLAGISYSFLVVLATILYGVNVNLIKSTLVNVPPLKIASVSFLATGILACLFLLGSSNLSLVLSQPEYRIGLGYLVLLGVVGTAFAVVMFNKLIKDTAAVFASSVTYFIPVVAVIWGLLDGESFNWLQVLGAAVIISGVKLIKS